jgi:hypothetical protein
MVQRTENDGKYNEPEVLVVPAADSSLTQKQDEDSLQGAVKNKHLPMMQYMKQKMLADTTNMRFLFNIIIIIIWFVKLRPLLAYCVSLG